MSEVDDSKIVVWEEMRVYPGGLNEWVDDGKLCCAPNAAFASSEKVRERRIQ